MSAGGPGRRAVLRWAVRLFRREWRQQLLVLVFVTVAVSAAVAGATVAMNAASQSSGEFGGASALIRLDDTDPAMARQGIAAARARYGTVDVVAHATIAVPGSVERLDVRDQDPHGAYSAPMLALRGGRYPTVAGEVALTKDTAGLLGATIGSTVTLGATTARVVGIVENPAQLSDEFALVAPGTLPAPATYTVLVRPGGPDGEVPEGLPGQTGFALHAGQPEERAILATVLAAVTLAMALVGLIAAAGFVVVAHRRQRQLGLLSAIGASERNVRLVMIANGAIVGVLAAVVGTVAGVAAWVLAAPAVESAADHRIGRFDLPWALIVAVVTLAVLVATVAAWWPARAASRRPVMAALSGRPVPPEPVHRSLLLALVLVGGGVVAIVLSQPRSEHVQPLLLIVGLLAVVIGAVFVAPAAIRSLGTLARHLPFAPRLALRDLARHQTRAAAALAAITLGLGIAVAVVGVASASEVRTDAGNLSDRELLVHVGDLRTTPDPDLAPADVARLDQRAAAVVAALGAGATGVPLDVAVDPQALSGPMGREPVTLGIAQDAHSLEFVGYPYVATPAVLALYGIDPASIDPTTDLLTERADVPIILENLGRRPDLGAPPPPSQHVDLPPYTSAPNSLLTEAAVQRYGWKVARAAWIIESDHALTAAQIRAARAAADDAGLAIEVRRAEDGISALRRGTTAVGALVAMAIVAMAVGLIRSESARDIRTLTATGAAPRTRRALTASTAAALAGLGVLLGTASAYVALLAAFHTDLGLLVPVPVGDLLPLAVGLPLAAAAAGWLLAGREPRTFARQALD